MFFTQLIVKWEDWARSIDFYKLKEALGLMYSCIVFESTHPH